MNELIRIHKRDNVYIHIETSPSVRMELKDYFSFLAPNYRYHPKFKRRLWDGRIHIYQIGPSLLYAGLAAEVEEFAQQRGYDTEYVGDWQERDTKFTKEEIKTFLDSLNIPLNISERDYQLETVAYCVSAQRALFVSPTACHAAGDRVLTPSGWKMVEDVQVGDELVGPDGRAKKVLQLHRGRDDLYKISPKNNRESIVVTGSHLLYLRATDASKKDGYASRYDNKPFTMSVNEYVKQSKHFKHCTVLCYNQTPFQTTDMKIDIDPYFLGLYLGDGHVHRCAVTNIDEEVISYLTSMFPGSYRKGMTTFILGKEKNRNVVFKKMQQLGLCFGLIKNRTNCSTKFIPEPCFNMSLSDRLQLMAGLIDSDGSLTDGTYYEFVSKSKALADGVQRLAITLGLISYTKEKYNSKYDAMYYKTVILGNIWEIPCKIERKKAEKYRRLRDPYCSSFEVTAIGQGDYYGFEVEDHLYLTHNGMITHNSGKSFMMYLITKFLKRPTLLIVPNKGLIFQMKKDFIAYGYDPEDIHLCYGETEKTSDKNLVIATWQTAWKQPEEWFERFGVIFGDEAHGFKAKSLIELMKKTKTIRYRFGFTGTLDGQTHNLWTLEGLFGPKRQFVKTKELIDQGYLAELIIKCLLLKHPEEVCQGVCRVPYKDIHGKTKYKRMSYANEIQVITKYKKRNSLVTNLAETLQGNTLILFRLIEHGKELVELLSKKVDRPVHLVYGAVEAEDRDVISDLVNRSDNSIIVASQGVFSEGVNIPNINSIILASPSKARIKIMQMIGRGLRRSETKSSVTVYDIADDMSYKKTSNHTLGHYVERLRYYGDEGFNYKQYKVDL